MREERSEAIVKPAMKSKVGMIGCSIWVLYCRVLITAICCEVGPGGRGRQGLPAWIVVLLLICRILGYGLL